MSKYKLLSPTRKIKPCRNHTQQNPITIMPHTDFLLNLKSVVSFLLRQAVLCIDRLPWFRKMKKALHAFLMKHACTLHEHILIQIWSRCSPSPYSKTNWFLDTMLAWWKTVCGNPWSPSWRVCLRKPIYLGRIFCAGKLRLRVPAVLLTIFRMRRRRKVDTVNFYIN